MTQPFLKVHAVSVIYPGGHHATSEVTFSIAKGERVGLVGESGSGKSTLARAILGLVPPSSGSIRIEGREFQGTNRKSRIDRAQLVQMVFQDPYHSLNPRRTIGQTLTEAIQAADKPIDRNTAFSQAGLLLEKVHLDASAMDRFPHQFSGGQRQRICIARALAPQPRLLVCDEAVSALDVTTQHSIVQLLRELSQEEKIALLFITHDIPLVEDLCHRIMILDQGSLVEEGPTTKILQHPQSPKTRQLLNAVLRI